MKILIVKLSSMGDIIHVLPALTDAQKAIPKISFDWVVEENFMEIPTWHKATNLVIPIALRRWRKQIFDLSNRSEIADFWGRLRRAKYDHIIDAQGLLKSAIITKLAHGVSSGFNKSSVREPLAAYFYERKCSVPKNLHAIERVRQLFAQTLNYKIIDGDIDYKIEKGIFSKERPSEKYLFFAHGTSRVEKYWPERNWCELAGLARDAGLQVKLPWGNSEELDRAKRIAAKNANVEVLPKLKLTELGSIILNSQGVVAVDTGLGHLAAALDVPAISLYGPTDPMLIGARGRHQSHFANMVAISAPMVWERAKLEFKL